MQIWTDLGTLGFSWSGPPLQKCRFGQILELWVSVGLDPPPLKMQIWTDFGTLGFSWSGTLTPPSENVDLDRSWHFENADLDRSWHFGIMWELVCGNYSLYPPRIPSLGKKC